MDVANLVLKIDSKGVVTASRSLDDLERQSDKTEKATTGLTRAAGLLGAALAGIGIAAIAKSTLDLADQYVLLTNKIKLVTDGSDELAHVQGELLRLSNDSYTPYSASVDLFTRMARATEDLGTSQDEVLRITETLNQAMIISGATTTEASNALIQLSQGFASGVLRGEEFNSISEQGSRVIEILADYLNVSVGELREMAAQGEITSQVMVDAFSAAASTIDEEFGVMEVSVSQAMVVLLNNWGYLVSDLNDATGATDAIATGLLWVAERGELARDALGELMAAIKGDDEPSYIAEQNEILKEYWDTLNAGSRDLEYWTGLTGLEWGVIGTALLAGATPAGQITLALMAIKEGIEGIEQAKAALAVDEPPPLLTVTLYERVVEAILMVQGKMDASTGFFIDDIGRMKNELSSLESELARHEGLTGFAQTLNDLTGGKEDQEYLLQRIALLRSTLDELSQVELSGMVDGLEAFYSEFDWATTKIEDMTSDLEAFYIAQEGIINEAFFDDLNQLTQGLDMFYAAHPTIVAATEQEWNEYIDQLGRVDAALDSFFGDIPAMANQLTTDIANAYRDMVGDMELTVDEQYAHEMASLNARRDEHLLVLGRMGADHEDYANFKNQIDVWYSGEAGRIEREKNDALILEYGSVFDGMELARARDLEDQETWAEFGVQVYTDFADGAKTALSSNLFDVLHGEFDSLSDAWESLWDTMLRTATDKLADIAVDWGIQTLSDVFFHDGAWAVGDNLKPDEYNAILQEGEMVIPQAAAAAIREALSGGDFNDLVAAVEGSVLDAQTGQIAGIITPDVAGLLGIDGDLGLLVNEISERFVETGISSVAGGAGLEGIYEAGSYFLAGETALAGSVLTGDILSATGAEAAFGSGGEATVADGAGFSSAAISGVAAFGLALLSGAEFESAVGSGIGSYIGYAIGGPIGSIIGSYLGSTFGSLFVEEDKPNLFTVARVNGLDKTFDEIGGYTVSDAPYISGGDTPDEAGQIFIDSYRYIQRSFNNLLEEHTKDMAPSEKEMVMWIADSSANYLPITSHHGNLGDNIGISVDSFADQLGRVFDYIKYLTQDGYTATDVGNRVNDFFTRDVYLDGVMAESLHQVTDEMAVGLTSPMGIEWWMWEGGPMSRNALYAFQGLQLATSGVGTYATGGLVDRLAVPAGEDGFAALQLGEGVISRRGMENLDRINLGTMGDSQDDLSSEVRQLRREMSQMMYQVAKNTGKSARQLRNWDLGGLPDVRLEAA